VTSGFVFTCLVYISCNCKLRTQAEYVDVLLAMPYKLYMQYIREWQPTDSTPLDDGASKKCMHCKYIYPRTCGRRVKK
jgi:hypothetical protein